MAQGPKPKADHAPRVASYVAALQALARRELSERQLRQRLLRKGYDAGEVDEAVARLKDERALDDARVAEAMVRTATSVKRRGKRRVRQQIESAGIAAPTARRIVDAAFESIDEDALIEAALARRLRGREWIEDDREFQRLFRYLLAQGFDTDQIMKTLTTRRRRG
jgi:regulatory protein